MKDLNTNDFGGSHIDAGLYQWVLDNIKVGSTILELGSGKGSTKNLSSSYQMISIEEDSKYVGLYNSKYIYAPIKKGWYDVEVLQKIDEDYDLIIVDGPVGEGNRWGFLDHLNLFNTNVPIIVDDIHRQAELELLQKLAKRLQRDAFIPKGVKYFGIIPYG